MDEFVYSVEEVGEGRFVHKWEKAEGDMDEAVMRLVEAAREAGALVVEVFNGLGLMAQAIRDDPFWQAYLAAVRSNDLILSASSGSRRSWGRG